MILTKWVSSLFMTLSLIAVTAVAAVAKDSNQILADYLNIEQNLATQKVSGFSPEDRQKLFNAVRDNKIAALTKENIQKYDPSEEIGFCYGRALAAHLIARRMGLKSSAIAKLFIIGDLRSGIEEEWRFHVTTVVRGTDGKWYAIDPLLVAPVGRNRPETLAGWVKAIRKVWDKKEKAYLYLVSPNSVMPDVREFALEPKDETGNNIADLTFQPSQNEGFVPRVDDGIRYYSVDAKVQQELFLQAVEAPANEQFDFTQLKMETIEAGKKSPVTYDYRGYFADLISDISKAKYETTERRLGATTEGTEIHGSENAGKSARGTEIHGTEIHGTEIHYGGFRPKRPKASR